MLCSYLTFPYITALASKQDNTHVLRTGCPAQSGLSRSAVGLWGIKALSTRASPSEIISKPGPHAYTEESNSFQRNCCKFFLPFPHLHVSTFLTQQHVLARTDMTRDQSGTRNIEIGTAMATGSLHCHQHPKKRVVPPKVKKSFWHLIILSRSLELLRSIQSLEGLVTCSASPTVISI